MTVTKSYDGTNKISIEGIDGQYDQVCFDANIIGKREFIMMIDDPGLWKFLDIISITSNGEKQKWFDDGHVIDSGAIKKGVNKKVNVENRVATERGPELIAFLGVENMDPDEIKIKFSYVDWRETKFWKRFAPIACILPSMVLLTLTTNHLIKIRKDVIKQYRCANDVNEFTGPL
jgi:hypothetical protein